MGNLYVIKAPKTLTIGTLPEFLQQVSPCFQLYREEEEAEIRFDLSDLEFIAPTGLSTLTSAALLFTCESPPCVNVTLVKPNSSDVDNYLSRMDFYKITNVDHDYSLTRWDSTGRFQ